MKSKGTSLGFVRKKGKVSGNTCNLMRQDKKNKAALPAYIQ